jgi:hypothetical protein
MPYILGIVTLAILAGGAVFLFQASRKEEPKVASKGGGKAAVNEVADDLPGGGEDAGTASRAPLPPPPAAAPAPPAPAPAGGGLRAEPRAKGKEPPEKFEPAATPPEGGNYGKSQGELLMMLKKERASVVVPMEHLPDTGPDLRTKIDADVALIADPNAGSDALHAIDRLAKIGRPAIPRVLAATAGLDFSKFTDIRQALDACKVADAVDAVLKRITAYDKIPDLQFSPTGDLSAYPRAVEDWYVWWFSNGFRRATFYRPVEEVEDSL